MGGWREEHPHRSRGGEVGVGGVGEGGGKPGKGIKIEI